MVLVISYWANNQDRVADLLGETPTDGYTILDVKGGWNITPEFSLNGGGNNLTNAFYVNHLNSKNPFIGSQIPETGISAF